MSKIKQMIVPLLIITIATVLVILSTYIDNLDKSTQILIGLAYALINAITIILAHRNRRGRKHESYNNIFIWTLGPADRFKRN